jgi:trehalose 6-phosphate phosphatase
LALLFDYDGTLTPIVEHPALARLEAPTLRLLKRLVLLPGIRVGIISGRMLDDLWELMDVPGLYYAGTSGLEFDLQGERRTVAAAEAYRDVVKEVANDLTLLALEFPGAHVEPKDLGLTLHYRGVSPEHCPELLVHAERILRRKGACLRMVEGPMAWEVTPNVAWDKGSALRLIVDSIGSPVIPLYAGDSANDAEAIATVIELGGVALGIGPEAPPSAHHQLNDPIALICFLTSLEQALADSRPGCLEGNAFDRGLASLLGPLNSNAEEASALLGTVPSTLGTT